MNGLELLNFFDEALEQEDAFGNLIIKQDDVVVMDNCGFHHANHVEGNLRAVLQTRNVELIFQPPYHPWYNTCEYCFHFMKVVLRRYPKYTEKYTELAISDTLEMISMGFSRQIYKCCGYS